MFIISSQYFRSNYSRTCGRDFGINGSNFLLLDSVGFRIGTLSPVFYNKMSISKSKFDEDLKV